MISKILDKVNQSTTHEIVTHLASADASFVPTLSSRVDIQVYAQKLQDCAVRFEAWLDEELVGLVACYCNQPDQGRAFVSSVSVLLQYQGLGIAERLIRHCIKHARGLGFLQMELEVDQRSLPAIALYQKLGFKTLCMDGSTLTMSKTFEMRAL